MSDDYIKGRHDAMRECAEAECGSCRDGRPVEYVAQLDEWFHRWPNGHTSGCMADKIRKLASVNGVRTEQWVKESGDE